MNVPRSGANAEQDVLASGNDGGEMDNIYYENKESCMLTVDTTQQLHNEVYGSAQITTSVLEGFFLRRDDWG